MVKSWNDDYRIFIRLCCEEEQKKRGGNWNEEGVGSKD